MAHVRQEAALGLARLVGAPLLFHHLRTFRFQFGSPLAHRFLQLAVPAPQQPVPPQNDAPHGGTAKRQSDRSRPPGFPPLRLNLDLRHSHFRRDRSVANTRPDLQPVPARTKPGKGDNPLRGIGPVFPVQPVLESHQLLALVAQRRKLGAENPRLLVDLQLVDNRLGNRWSL